MEYKKGQVQIYTLMIAIVLIILALAFIPVLKQFNDDARAADSTTAVGLDCNNSSISTFDRATCTVSDMNMPLFVGILFGLAGAAIGAKVLFGG